MLESGLLKDNAPVPEITGKLTKLVGTLFPQGSVHFQINNSCKETTIVASLSSDDPGTTPILRKTGGNSKGNDNGNMVSRAVGRDDFEPLRPLLPDSIVETIEQCFERCNIA